MNSIGVKRGGEIIIIRTENALLDSRIVIYELTFVKVTNRAIRLVLRIIGGTRNRHLGGVADHELALRAGEGANCCSILRAGEGAVCCCIARDNFAVYCPIQKQLPKSRSISTANIRTVPLRADHWLVYRVCRTSSMHVQCLIRTNGDLLIG